MAVFLLMAVITLVDQFSKYLVRLNIPEGYKVEILGKVLTITHYENTGAAFSTLSGQRFILLVVPIVVTVLGIGYLIYKRKTIDGLLKYSICLVVSGGFSNLIDRFFYGSVTDMISISFYPAIFNIADISVVIGCLLMAIHLLKPEKKERLQND